MLLDAVLEGANAVKGTTVVLFVTLFALCVNVKLPDLSPEDVGAKVAVNTWFPPAAIVAVDGETVTSVFVDVTDEITRDTVPEFVTVNVLAEVELTATEPKRRL